MIFFMVAGYCPSCTKSAKKFERENRNSNFLAKEAGIEVVFWPYPFKSIGNPTEIDIKYKLLAVFKDNISVNIHF